MAHDAPQPETSRRLHQHPRRHQQRSTRPLRHVYTKNFTCQNTNTSAELDAASKELMQEFEPAPAASTPEPIRILSRKEQIEKEVTIAREELRMRRISENQARVSNTLEMSVQHGELMPVDECETVVCEGVEEGGQVCDVKFGHDQKTDEAQESGVGGKDKKEEGPEMWLVSDMENRMESSLSEVFGERTRRVGCEVRDHS
jgi:hypothetical protein